MSRFVGTYYLEDKVEWKRLKEENFGSPDWAQLYPINSKGLPAKLLPPRTACKLFHDTLFLIEKAEENPKYLQDRIPEICHKYYKKKQWRKQMFESARRVACRLALGLSFNPNCVGEDVIIHVVLRDAFELGWRKVAAQIEHLPECDKDRDFNRIVRLATSEEVSGYFGVSLEDKTAKAKGVSKPMDFKKWYKAYEEDNVSDHVM